MNNAHESSSLGGYRSPSSNFHDELTAAGALKQICEITYLDPQGKEVLVISPVHDLYAENGMDYVRLDKGSIPLDRITGVNGRRGNDQVDDALLQKGLQPDAAPATGHHKYPEEEARTGMNAQPRTRAQIIPDPTPAAVPIAHAAPAAHAQDDFMHRFLTSPPPFIVAENDLYHFSADRLHHRLYFRVKSAWGSLGDVPDLGSQVARVAPLIGPECTLLNDLTNITPDAEGTVWAPPFPNRDALLRNGLLRVADLVGPGCETLVHGMEAFSVNSVPLRYFKDRVAAEHWLTSEREDTDSISLTDHP
jgi:hypothetical protein